MKSSKKSATAKSAEPQTAAEEVGSAGINTVQFMLGDEATLTPLYEFYDLTRSWKSGDEALREGMEHAFTFTMLRDGFYGGWAHVWKEASDNMYYMKMTSPNPKDDVQGYKDLVPKYLKAVALACKSINKALVGQTSEMAVAHLRFLPPFGLSMLNTKGVLLLHYPPDETADYKDYLHSRTTKRWESLLISNGHPGGENPLLESIVDVYPVTADGGSDGSKLVDALCDPVRDQLAKYAYDVLTLLLRREDVPGAKVTQPMVALGGVVRTWLFNNAFLRSQIESQLGPLKKASDLKVLSHFKLQLQPKSKVLTPVLVMDHPCNYYRGNPPGGRDKQLKTDLIGTRWFINMAANPESDPAATLVEAQAYWKAPANQAEFARISRDQIIEFQNITSGTEC